MSMCRECGVCNLYQLKEEQQIQLVNSAFNILKNTLQDNHIPIEYGELGVGNRGLCIYSPGQNILLSASVINTICESGVDVSKPTIFNVRAVGEYSQKGLGRSLVGIWEFVFSNAGFSHTFATKITNQKFWTLNGYSQLDKCNPLFVNDTMIKEIKKKQ